MKILVVAATQAEIEPSTALLRALEVDILITGVGMVATAITLSKRLSQVDYTLIINMGIGGIMVPKTTLGTVFQVVEDEIYELGAEDQGAFIPLSTLGYGRAEVSARRHPLLEQHLAHLPTVRGITVNKVHGDSSSIAHLKKQGYTRLMESMEGAAVLHTADYFKTCSIQLRGASNYIEPRNRASWQIPVAIQNVNRELQQLVQTLLQG